MIKRRSGILPPAPLTPADLAELAEFDPTSKRCTMNCGPAGDDPRTNSERVFLCGDCEVQDLPGSTLSDLLVGVQFPSDLLARATAHCDATFAAYKAAERPLLLGTHGASTALEHNTLRSECDALEQRYRVAANVRRRLVLAMEAAEHFLDAVAPKEESNV